ncbi:MAG: phosphoglycerate mutase family protein, partial [Bryobacteraceae bacterium]
MSTLILIRHGQATAFSEVTDRLSEIGVEQSRKLGEYWVRQGLRFDEVYSGPLERQRRTAEIAGRLYQEAGLSWPAVCVLPELAEYPAEEILGRGVPELSSRDPHFRELATALQL